MVQKQSGKQQSGKQQSHQADVVVIGAGPGGYVAAIRAAQLGLKVFCLEAQKTLGGTCLNVGCIPSKALLQSSHLWHDLAHYTEHGIEVESAAFNLEKMMERKSAIVKKNTSGIRFLFKKHGITALQGRGCLTADPHLIEVRGVSGVEHTIQTRFTIIATGSEVVELTDIAAFDHQVVCDSTDALAWDSVPQKLVVIGGGVIGLELGSVWHRLGSQVEVVEMAPRLLPSMDGAFSRYMQKKLTSAGITLHLATTLTDLKVKDSKAELTVQKSSALSSKNAASRRQILSADKVLVSVGRKPHSQGLGLERLGVATDDRGRIAVDDRGRTSVEDVFALGDVTAGPMLAHKAEEEGIMVAEEIAGLSPPPLHRESIAQVVYTWPELASVGAAEHELKEQNIPYKSGLFSLKGNARAKVMGDDSGWVKIYAHEHTDRLLGVHIAAPQASELIAEAAVAMSFGASAEDLARICHAHPTLSEAVKEAALAVDQRSLHS